MEGRFETCLLCGYVQSDSRHGLPRRGNPCGWPYERVLLGLFGQVLELPFPKSSWSRSLAARPDP